MGDGAEFMHGFHAPVDLLFWRFSLEKLENRHGQLGAYIIKHLQCELLMLSSFLQRSNSMSNLPPWCQGCALRLFRTLEVPVCLPRAH